jgi:hypothetical protein
MTPRRSTFHQALSLALVAALSGVPSVAAAAAQAAPPIRSDTPIADAAVRAAVQAGETRTEMPPGLKWTGFGLIVGGGSLIALGAVIDDTHCFGEDDLVDNDVFDNDCENARTAAYLAGGIMAGVGVGLLIMGHASRRPVSPTITMQHGRMMVQQRVRF